MLVNLVHPGKKTNGSAHAATSGTRSTLEASAQCAFTSGLRRSAFRAAAGRRTRSGMGDRKQKAFQLPTFFGKF
jgi:hypothetical protein